MQPSYPATPPGRLWRILHFPPVALALGLVMTVLPSTLVQVAARRLLGIDPHAAAPTTTLAVTIAAILAALGGYRLFNRWIERRPNVELSHRHAARELGAGLAAGLVLFSVVVGVIALLGGYHVVGRNPASVLLPALTLALASGFVEELIARGLIFRLLEQWLGSWAAIALFGAGHLANPHSSWLAATCIAIEAGVMLAALYMLTRRLWAAIGLHAAWNFAQGGIYGIPVSGFALPGLLASRASGSALLTGGAFGAEASLPALLIDGAFGVALLAACVRRDRVVPFLPRRRAPGPAVSVL